MKISNETISILKNFATINPGIVFRPGNLISTISVRNNIFAEARISEIWPQEFGIYDLNNFLSVLSLFKDGAELEFDSKHVIVCGLSGRSKIHYRVTDPTMLVAAPHKSPAELPVDVRFKLSLNDLSWIIKTSNVLNVPNVSVKNDGTKTCLFAFDANNDSAHTNTLELTNVECPDNIEYNLIFRTENLKLIPGDYNVEITAKKRAKFSDPEKGITYYIALETTSTYN